MALAGATVFFQGLSLAHRILDPDEAGYSAIAALMNAGGGLYADGGVDNKPPVVFWVYSLVFRAFGRYDLAAVHAFKVAVVLATALFVALIARRIAGDLAAAAAAVLYVIFTAAGYGAMAAANTEVLMMLPATASAWLMLERRWALSGALLAVAVLTKQVAIVQLALYPAAVVLLNTRLRSLLEAAAGFAAGLILLLAILALTGSVSGFWHWAVVDLITNYGPSAWSRGQVLGNIQGSVLPWLKATPLLILPAVLRAALVRVDGEERFTQAWFVLAALGSAAGGHFFPHYFIEMVGPLAVLSGVALMGWKPAVERPVLGLAVAALLLAPAVVYTLRDYREAGFGPDPVSLYVAQHSRPGERVFVWGNSPAVYVYSGLVPATRFPGFLRGFPRTTGLPPLNWDTTPDVWPQLADDFRQHPAAFVVDTSTADWASFRDYPMSRFPTLPEIIATRYYRSAAVAGVDIYRLR